MAESSNNVSEHNIQREQGHSSIEIRDLDDDLVSFINNKLEATSRLPSECCIYRVPNQLRAVNEKAYVPQIVSIGPFHYGKVNLQDMEEQKWHYVKSFLSRSPLSLKDYVNAIRELEERARKCYAETINISSNEFVKMMIVDGCFIIELFFRLAKVEMIDNDDPIFNRSWMFPSVSRDLILLENQLPFFILECLFNHNAQDHYQEFWTTCLIQFVVLFFGDMIVPETKSDLKGKHLLDLLRNCLIPSTNFEGKEARHSIHCAKELQQAGIKFKKGESNNKLLDIKFNNGVMELSHLTIEDSTESIFRNLIAFEQCHSGCTTLVTSYAFLMDSLVKGSKDVKVLCDSEILDNWLGKEEDISRLFNELGLEVTLDDFYYSELCEQVNAYYKTKWHMWKANLKRDYFHNPWAILSFVAAILLLIFTFTQTLFSILSYSP